MKFFPLTILFSMIFASGWGVCRPELDRRSEDKSRYCQQNECCEPCEIEKTKVTLVPHCEFVPKKSQKKRIRYVPKKMKIKCVEYVPQYVEREVLRYEPECYYEECTSYVQRVTYEEKEEVVKLSPCK